MEKKRNAYEIVKELIFEGKIPPGTPLIESAMAERIGLSRIPIREAFQRLALEGLLINAAGKGLHTRTYNEQDLIDLYLYREALDGMATRLFTIRADKMEIQYLKMVYAEMEKMLNHFERKYEEEKDIEFHQAIARGSRNTRIITAIENLYQECFYLVNIFRHERYKSYSETEAPPHLLEAIKDHKSILDSTSSGDPDAAEEAARKSVRSALHRLMNNFIEINRKSVIPEKPAKKVAGENI